MERRKALPRWLSLILFSADTSRDRFCPTAENKRPGHNQMPPEAAGLFEDFAVYFCRKPWRRQRPCCARAMTQTKYPPHALRLPCRPARRATGVASLAARAGPAYRATRRRRAPSSAGTTDPESSANTISFDFRIIRALFRQHFPQRRRSSGNREFAPKAGSNSKSSAWPAARPEHSSSLPGCRMRRRSFCAFVKRVSWRNLTQRLQPCSRFRRVRHG